MPFPSPFPDSAETEQQLVRQVTHFSQRRILELGSGDGRTFAYYSDDITQLVGLDTDWTELRLARDAGPHPLIHGDAVTLPLADSSFDLVVWSWAF